MKVMQSPSLIISMEREQIEVTSAGILGMPASVAREFIPGRTTVTVEINGEEFRMSKGHYEMALMKFADVLRSMEPRR